ncbi:acyltransferase family protein [Aquihabitans daechungensis]|uniref:acyltransferase family protein n=1 Tax=Aquihabitans daechungensis TaxID=1052257 RepID=UPI003B9F6777
MAFAYLQLTGASDTRLYEGTDTRSFALFAGAALACWWRIDQRRPRTASGIGRSSLQALGPPAVILLAVAWVSLDGRSPVLYAGGLQACSLLAVAVIGASVLPGGIPVFDRVLHLAPLRLLGLISYGLYLWHWPVYLVINEVRTNLSGPLLLTVRIAVSIALATASYLLLERRIRHGGLLHGGAAFVAVPASMVLIAGLTMVVTSGAVDVEDVNAVNTTRKPVTVVPGLPNVVYLGDSVAGALAEFPAADSAGYGINAFNVAEAGCGLIYEGNRVRGGAGDVTEPESCTPGWPAALRAADADAALVTFGASPTSAIEIDGSFRTACDPAYDAMLRERLDEQVEKLGATGATVILVTNAPTTNPFRLPEADPATDCVNEVITAVAEAGPAELIDLAGFVCPDGVCQDEFDGAPTRPDSVHYHGPGGAVPARWLAEQAALLVPSG